MSSKFQLYSFATPNGHKISIALEEMGLAYDTHYVDIFDNAQFKDDFIGISPNSKIPVLVDPDGPGGKKIAIFESGAILLYLAEKTQSFLSIDPVIRIETLQWLFFQMASIGPMFGQFGHFYKYAREKVKDDYPLSRYKKEIMRLLLVLDDRLKKEAYLAGSEYSIADIACFPWVLCLDWAYGASKELNLAQFSHVQDWVKRCESRPNAKKGLLVPPR